MENIDTLANEEAIEAPIVADEDTTVETPTEEIAE